MLSFKNCVEVKRFIKDKELKFASFYVPDIEGRLRNVTIPAKNFTGKLLQNGIGFDASNFGFANVESSDMIFKPDMSSAFIDPVDPESKILYFFCDVFDAHTGESFSQDLRHIIQKALKTLTAEGIADEMQVLIELEFNIIDELFSIMSTREVSYRLASSEMASPPSGEEIYRLAPNRGYHRSEPNDHFFKIRNEIVLALQELGIGVKYHHHEVGTSQAEIEFKFGPIEKSTDATVLAKNISHRIAKKHGKIISFLPKIIPGEAGNGMHIHMFLKKDGKNIFNDPNGLYKLSKTALYFIGGILSHSASLSALTNPTSNSYRRLVAGLEAPSKAVFAEGNRSAAIRIPAYVKDPEKRRFEFRPTDATCNPYLAFAALIMAGIDGVRKKIDPIEKGFGPLESNLYKLSAEELMKIPSFPDTLEFALHSLKHDNDYLTYGNVLPTDLLLKWIRIKRKDLDEMRKIPHPWEIARYYDL
ncbi:MAG: type I glutamate--ammonia ligase [Candidatus Cloacimonas sp. 4484_140]|nr:MAG: type I glutamate--ammonia ligase [Candidatus Cloacimonas sp. 4484_140]